MAKKSRRAPPAPVGGRRATRAGSTNSPNASGGQMRPALNERLAKARSQAAPVNRERWVTVELAHSENGNPVFIQKKDAPGHPVYRAAHLVDTKLKVLSFWSEDRGADVRETSDRKLLTRAASKAKVELSEPGAVRDQGDLNAGTAFAAASMTSLGRMGESGGHHPQAQTAERPVAEPSEDTGVSGPRRRR